MWSPPATRFRAAMRGRVARSHMSQAGRAQLDSPGAKRRVEQRCSALSEAQGGAGLQTCIKMRQCDGLQPLMYLSG